MAVELPRAPIEYLKEVNLPSADGFRALREGVMKSGPLDYQTCELIMLGAFVATGYDVAVKIHAKRLLDLGLPKAAVQQAVLVTFGATATLVDVTRALAWIDEVAE